MKVSCVGVALLSLLTSAYGQVDFKDLQAKVRAEYVRHEMVLRKPAREQKLKFDDGGNPVAPLTPVPLVDGAALLITDAHLAATELRLDAVRLLLVGPKLEPMASDENETVSIEFRVPVSSLDEIHAAMPHVFLTPPEFQQVLANYYVSLTELKAAKAGEQLGTIGSSEPVFKVGNGVTPPRAVQAPDPDYTPLAKKQHYEGTTVLDVVVDSQGRTAFMQVEKPLKYGLTEKALQAVANWKFLPAMRGASPVASMVNVEVNFRLY